MKHALLIAISALLTLTLPARAQTVQVEAGVGSAKVSVGDLVDYVIVISGAEEGQINDSTDPSKPVLKGITKATFEFAGSRPESSRSVMIVNGRRTDNNTLRVRFVFRITPTEEGRITIPPQTVIVGGKAYLTNGVAFEAVQPVASPDYKLTLVSPKTRAYVGEPVTMRLTWFVAKNVKSGSFAFTGPDGGSAYDIVPLDPRPPGVQPNDNRFVQVKFLGNVIGGQIGQGELDGRNVTTLSIDFTIIPRKAGRLEIGPYRVAFSAVVGQRQRNFFDLVDDTDVTERRVVGAQPIFLECLDLPTEGRPANFSGLVGDYAISATSSISKANVGDPVPLSVTITGPEPLEVTPPPLDSLPEFAGAFKSAPEGWEASKTGARGTRTFTTTVRPRSDSVTQIPGIPLSFFDSTAGAYRTAASTPLPLKVAPTRELTSADAVVSGPAAPIARRPLADAGPGIRANTTSLDALRTQRVDLAAFALSPAGLALLAGPPVLCLSTLLIRRTNRLDTPAARTRHAIRAARSRLKSAASPAEVGDALRSCLAARSGLPATAITSIDCATLLRNHAPVTIDRAEEVLAASERAGFGKGLGEAHDLQPLRDQARAVLDDLASHPDGGRNS